MDRSPADGDSRDGGTEGQVMEDLLFDIIYALMARGGRDKVLFGDGLSLAREALSRSRVGQDFPELWFELPLAGDPWFDFHALTSVQSLEADPEAAAGAAVYPHLFSWFARQGDAVRQLALSYDISQGDIDHPAVQLLMNRFVPEVTCAFLEEAGKLAAATAYRAFIARLPEGWYPCYMGVFPCRPNVDLRVECIPVRALQQAYARDAALLEHDLRQMGMKGIGDTVVPRCQYLAQTPFNLEFQFNVELDGSAGNTLGASLRFASTPGEEEYLPFEVDGAAGDLMETIESWGLADERWRLLAETRFSKRISKDGVSQLIYAYPAFIKLRWRDGAPVDAKTYLMAGVQ